MLGAVTRVSKRPRAFSAVQRQTATAPTTARSSARFRSGSASQGPLVGRGRLWLSKTSYALRRLRLRMFSDSLVSWRPSSSRCSTLFGSCSDHGCAAPGNHRAPTPADRRESISPPASSLTRVDRMFWAWLSRSWGGWRSAIHIVKPETVLRWHRRGFRLFWTWKSRHRYGRPTIAPDVRAFIREMSTANPLWGAPRVHGCY